MGTLDPLASGVLPLALGRATRLIPYYDDGEKTYVVTVRFGEQRDTDDVQGTLLATSTVPPCRASLEDVLPRFLGVIDQIPPRFAAIKRAGVRAYQRARRGEEFSLPARRVEIFSLVIEEWLDAYHVRLRCRCGKGCYMRALARDLGESIGVRACLSALRRVSLGGLTESDAVALERVRLDPLSALRPLDFMLSKTASPPESIEVSSAKVFDLVQGRAIPCRASVVDSSQPVALYHGASLVAMARVRSGWLHPERVLMSLIEARALRSPSS